MKIVKNFIFSFLMLSTLNSYCNSGKGINPPSFNFKKVLDQLDGFSTLKSSGTVCTGSIDITSPFTGLTLSITISYTTQSSCNPPSYCEPGSSSGVMVASVMILGAPDWEFEGTPTGAALNAVFGPCFYARTYNENNNPKN